MFGATENERRSEQRVDICFNKAYRNLGYLSNTQQCEGCLHETNDLFTGTTGLQIWQWYCKPSSP